MTVGSAAALAMDNMDTKSMDMKMMGPKMMDPKMMDKDGDNMISRTEFMSAHEMMFDHMKNKQDMISVKDLQEMKKARMKGNAGVSDSTTPNDRDAMGRTKP